MLRRRPLRDSRTGTSRFDWRDSPSGAFRCIPHLRVDQEAISSVAGGNGPRCLRETHQWPTLTEFQSPSQARHRSRWINGSRDAGRGSSPAGVISRLETRRVSVSSLWFIEKIIISRHPMLGALYIFKSHSDRFTYSCPWSFQRAAREAIKEDPF